MTFVWLILKIILYILLGILSVLLGILCIVLFFPVDYQVYYEKYRQSFAQVKIRLFYVIKCIYDYEDEKGKLNIYVMGIRIGPRKVSLEEDEELGEEMTESTEEKEEASTVDTTPSARVLDKVSASLKTHETSSATKAPKKKISSAKNKKQKNWMTTFKKVWKSPHKKGFIDATWKMLKAFILVLKPKSIRFNLIIGKEDPSETGQLVAKLAMAYPLYHKYGSIEGYYVEEGIWGEIQVTGRLCIAKLLKPFIGFIINKEVRNYIKIILNVRKEDRNGNKA